MDDSATAQTAAPAETLKPRSELRDTLSFLLKLAILVFIVRSFVFAPFSIPSGSMLPRLLVGDYLFITKWNYGYSKHSLPWSLPLIPGRVFAKDPARGDVVVFKAPPDAKTDWIKRVIGVPGDTVQMRGGQLILNGKAIPKQRVADFVLPMTPNADCDAAIEATAEGTPVCRIARYRETLPGGKSYDVLDAGMSAGDDTELFTVPAGHVFLMGDNRDNSSDSRFEPALDTSGVNRGGIRFVPIENIQGKAVVSFWSTDGSASWVLPWTWFSAARFDRIGDGFLSDSLPGWLAGVLGAAPGDMALYQRALTHGSQGAVNYERLEFLGDRVLGLTLAEWLYERFPGEPEGKLSRRFNALVTGQMCAQVAREIGVSQHLKLGKQARDDGASDSDNVLGDVMEALIGATFLDQGFDAARALVRRLWDSRIDAQESAPKHPKSALQEWAAANNRRAPDYVLVDRSGPGHAPRFRVKAEIGKLAEAQGEGSSKQEAETAAAAALLAVLQK